MKKYLIIIILTFIISDKINAQANANNWTWINGTKTRNPQGLYGVFNSYNPGGRTGHVTQGTFTFSSKLIMLGGYGKDGSNNTGYLNDLWQYDFVTKNWTWLKGSNTIDPIGVYGVKGTAASANTPGARGSSSSWFFNNKFYVWGGYGKDGLNNTGHLNDLWQYDPTINSWTWLRGSNTKNQLGVYGNQGGGNVLNEPGARNEATSWSAGVLYLMGGQGYGSTGTYGSLNDLWKYDPVTNNWSWIKGSNTIDQSGVYGVQGVPNTNNLPGSRSVVSSWELNGQLYLMGGYGYDGTGVKGFMNDLWKYNPATNNWTWLKGSNVANPLNNYGTKGIAAPSNTPSGRRGSATWVFNNRLYLMGGTFNYDIGGSFSYNTYNDLWEYDPTTNNWTWLKGSNLPHQAGTYGTLGVSATSNVPGARELSGTPNLFDNKIYLLGGYGTDNTTNYGYMNDLWEYVPCLQMVSIAAGDWNDPNTWSCGKVPSYNDPVKIGHILSVSGTGFCKNITYTLGGKVNVLSGGNLKINTP